MNRNYTFEDYLLLIKQIRNKIKGAVITTDVIVGFPGEREADFQESCENIAKCQFDDIHIFKYSVRKGTKAASMSKPDYFSVSQHQMALRAAVLKGIKMQAKYLKN